MTHVHIPLPTPRSKLPTHHPEDRNTLGASRLAAAAAANGAALAPLSCSAELAQANGANGAAGGAIVDPKAQDLQFLFLAMTEEVGGVHSFAWLAGWVLAGGVSAGWGTPCRRALAAAAARAAPRHACN